MRASAAYCLDFHGTLLWKCPGLTGEQLIKASIEPSTMSLLGLVRQLTEDERYWFQMCLAGLPAKRQLWTAEHPRGDFDLVDAAQAAKDLADLKAQVVISDDLTRDLDLDCTFRRPKRDGEWSLRWFYIHMVEECRYPASAPPGSSRASSLTGFAADSVALAATGVAADIEATASDVRNWFQAQTCPALPPGRNPGGPRPRSECGRPKRATGTRR
ncbi:MAG: hypothetical protein QOH50_3110 [Kribbellaceae bacterium]|nr:hypothetical protein [Kribbellaceae bacterium]